ncbi:MAG: hypothetical protein KDA31_02280 [Phycisphaerales bacterium]|nr:hypothetical protein [Phycisphaerales bacterium]MCB9835658.1 hypothetical protein [Phycisphaera sp.]
MRLFYLKLLIVQLFLTLSSQAQPVLVSSNTTIGPTDTEIQGVPLVTADITVRGATLTLNGRHSINSLVIEQGGKLTHSAGFTYDYSNGNGTDIVQGFSLVSAGNVLVEQGCSIDTTNRGHTSSGPGGGSCATSCGMCAGGGYGGAGANSRTYCGGTGTGGSIYGSITEPKELGSGAGGGGGVRGGGSVQIEIGGSLLLNGNISSNGGGVFRSGGGSGGSVFITATSIDGIGNITANGGNGSTDMGGGGGGRICLRYDNYSLKGTVSAFGGAGYFNAAAGSVLMLDTSGVSFLIFDNGGRTVNKVTTLPDPLLQCDTLIVRGNAILSHIPGDTNGLRIVATNVIIEQDGLISANNAGYTTNGPGSGTCQTSCHMCGGGGYGGHGSDSRFYCGGMGQGGNAYGSAVFPRQLGSGGGNGTRGGGAIHINVWDDLVVEGSLTANGQFKGSAGGGSGGSILIHAKNIMGSGTISATGGNGSTDNGGGGGGRISLYADQLLMPVENILTHGGDGYNDGHSGSLLIRPLRRPIVAEKSP